MNYREYMRKRSSLKEVEKNFLDSLPFEDAINFLKFIK